VCSEDLDRFDPWLLPPPPQDRITLEYPRPDTPLYPFTPIPQYVDTLVANLPVTGLINDGGVLVVLDVTGWATESGGVPGSVWSNGNVVNVNLPVPSSEVASPLIFGSVGALAFLALSPGRLSTFRPLAGSRQIYVVGEEAWVA